MSVKKLFNKYVKNTKYKENIIISKIFVCVLRKEIIKILFGNKLGNVFITTRSLKHIYDRHIFDKKVPKDFYFILKKLKHFVLNTNRIYMDADDKRGNYILVKIINNKFYMCTIEIINIKEIEIVSASVTGEKYLSKFTLLWSWGPANSPS